MLGAIIKNKMIKIKGILVLVYLIFSISKSNCQISYAENLYGLGMYLYTVAREDLKLNRISTNP